MTKEELQKKIKELGIIMICDADSQSAIEDAIKAVEETNKSPAMIAAPLVIDGETDRKLFNTREKIIAYFAEKNLDISTQREVLRIAMGADKTFYTGANSEEQKLLCDIAMYLTYNWVKVREMDALIHGGEK